MDRLSLNGRHRRDRVVRDIGSPRRRRTRSPRSRGSVRGGAGRLLVLRQEPRAQSRRRVRQGPHRDGHERSRATLDQRLRPVRRGRLYGLRRRLVLRNLEGAYGQGQELLLRRHDAGCNLGEGEHRQPDDQAPRGRRRTQGDAQRLARELRLEYRQRPRNVHRRFWEGAHGDQDRAGLDARRRRHGAPLPHGHRPGGSRRRDRDDHVHRPRELQPGGR